MMKDLGKGVFPTYEGRWYEGKGNGGFRQCLRKKTPNYAEPDVV